ncbi:DUF6879 family protein [Streptomyces sp. NPDC059909]|uniref:DUF6879 family protein n=1 Tax=Streptomyces sp. NPDC059909 TaxID=3346998 RepID=UPI00365DF4BB
MPDLITGEAFGRLFEDFEHTAWRLETRTLYTVDEEQEPFARHRRGEDPRHGFQPWLDTMRRGIEQGKRIERVRIVPEVLTAYLEFELWLCQFNVQVGEDIRYLPQDQADKLGLPDYDYWLFDSRRLGRMHFTDKGVPLGTQIIEDPAEAVRHSRPLLLHPALWAIADVRPDQLAVRRRSGRPLSA